MKDNRFLRAFVQECRHYDPQQLELNAILRSVSLRGKRILDIGTGIGRLAFPLARYTQEVVAIDKKRIFGDYFKKHRRKNVLFFPISAESYLKKPRSFDIFLLAWPTLNPKLLTLIRKSMTKESLCIFITCDNRSDWETTVDRLGTVRKQTFHKDIANKQRFLRLLPKKFHIALKRKVHTSFTYPNERSAFRSIQDSLDMWFHIKLDKRGKERLRKDIRQHHRLKNVVYGEDIWFYILKNS